MYFFVLENSSHQKSKAEEKKTLSLAFPKKKSAVREKYPHVAVLKMQDSIYCC